MNLLRGFVPKATALALAIALSSVIPALARGGGGGGHGGGGHGGGGHHGGGHHGGRGYHRVHRGGYGYRGSYGYGYGTGYYGYSYPTYTYSSGYSYAPTTYVTQAPYLTSQTYEPGDGYRYPLYYNPATGTYIYYPVAR